MNKILKELTIQVVEADWYKKGQSPSLEVYINSRYKAENDYRSARMLLPNSEPLKIATEMQASERDICELRMSHTKPLLEV